VEFVELTNIVDLGVNGIFALIMWDVSKRLIATIDNICQCSKCHEEEHQQTD